MQIPFDINRGVNYHLQFEVTLKTNIFFQTCDSSPECKLHKIAEELFKTEKAYVSRLYLLDKVICDS